jgi:excisionase family DNA binding protein
MSPADRPTLSVAETAELLGISRWLVQQAVRDSSLPSVRVGRRILIPRVQLDAWLSGQLSSGLVVTSDKAPPEAPLPRSRAV